MATSELTVAELIERLSKFPPGHPVCLRERVHEQGGADFDILVPLVNVTLTADPWSQPPRPVIALATK